MWFHWHECFSACMLRCSEGWQCLTLPTHFWRCSCHPMLCTFSFLPVANLAAVAFSQLSTSLRQVLWQCCLQEKRRWTNTALLGWKAPTDLQGDFQMSLLQAKHWISTQNFQSLPTMLARQFACLSHWSSLTLGFQPVPTFLSRVQELGVATHLCENPYYVRIPNQIHLNPWTGTSGTKSEHSWHLTWRLQLCCYPARLEFHARKCLARIPCNLLLDLLSCVALQGLFAFIQAGTDLRFIVIADVPCGR